MILAEPQAWRRLGHVYNSPGNSSWAASHASYPTPLPLGNGIVRIWFSPRDTYETWIFFDDRWVAAHPTLAEGMVRFDSRWDVL